MGITFFGLTFHLYGLFIGLAVLSGLETALWLAKKRKMETVAVEKMFWWVVVAGIAGARLYHVIDKWQEIYRFNPMSVFYVWNGGLGIWGAVMGGLVGLYGYWIIILRKKINLLNLTDVALVGLPLSQAVGRLGNFFNQELYGLQTNLPWGIRIDGLPGKYHPLFAYEALLNLILFGFLVQLAKKKDKTGLISGVYLIGYGLIRFALELLRPDNIVWKTAGMPTAMILSVIAVVVGLILIMKQEVHESRPGHGNKHVF